MSPDPRRGIVTLFDWSTASNDNGSLQETAQPAAVHNRLTSAVNNRLPVSLRETQFVYRENTVTRKPSKNERSKPRPIIKRDNTSPMIITNVLNNSGKTAAFSHFIDGRAMTIMSQSKDSQSKDSVSASRKHVTFSDSMCTGGSKSGASSDSDSDVNLDESINIVTFPGSIHPEEGSTDTYQRTLVRRRSYKSVFPPIVTSFRQGGARDSPRKTHRATVIDIYLPTTGSDGSETSSSSPDDVFSPRDGTGSMTGTIFRPMFTRRSVKWSKSLDASMSSTSSEDGVAPMASSPHDSSTSPKRPLGEIRRTTSTTVHVNNMMLP